ncbi:flagellar basal body rod modification protein [Botrimarina colliarenosi]|uniref:Basal-body rod modification protein FlgD n=1 Tax=Botrimarina colliarenosi TaxID=2528001 RepID=A0A5C6AMH9_9BACT|nr:flagellar hook capping FlgD N-terminal domain-containing protein [Botrimarina colliarenosi]TWU00326.1 flagellar basal body rod modification protein [Botrimarina colliarenosi]
MSAIDDNAAYAAAQAKAAQVSQPGTYSTNSIESLDLTTFLDLMLTQLQQQDPLEPMDNQEMLNTISQIREIGASDKLSETLDSVLLGQNIATASNLIGKQVQGLTDSGQRVLGAVQQVSINDGAPRLELAIETGASAGTIDGGIPDGTYKYEVVWETDDGLFSVQAEVDTADFGDDYKGSIRLENLPQLDSKVSRKVYRTDGASDPQLVGVMPNGLSTSFTDAVAELGEETLTGQRSILRYADSVSIKLSNVSGVETLK